MLKNKSISPNLNKSLQFKNWSRKGYAIFCSLGKVVHIAGLTVDMVQWIGRVVENVETRLEYLWTKVSEEVDETLIQEEYVLVPLQITADEVCQIVENKNINCRQ